MALIALLVLALLGWFAQRALGGGGQGGSGPASGAQLTSNDQLGVTRIL